MRLETSTLIVMATVTVVLAVWDIYARVKQPDGKATESWLMRYWSQRWPITAVVWGVLTGHFFWPQKSPPVEPVCPASSQASNAPTEDVTPAGPEAAPREAVSP